MSEAYVLLGCPAVAAAANKVCGVYTSLLFPSLITNTTPNVPIYPVVVFFVCADLRHIGRVGVCAICDKDRVVDPHISHTDHAVD